MVARGPDGKFLKGESGNPGGRPVAQLTTLIDSAVTSDDWKQIITQLVKMARRGNLKAIEMLMDRRFGKPTQKSEISGPDGSPVSVSRIEIVLPPESVDGSNG